METSSICLMFFSEEVHHWHSGFFAHSSTEEKSSQQGFLESCLQENQLVKQFRKHVFVVEFPFQPEDSLYNAFLIRHGPQLFVPATVGIFLKSCKGSQLRDVASV